MSVTTGVPLWQALTGALFAFAVFTQAGRLVQLLLFPSRASSRIESAALAFVLGTGLVTWEMLLFGIAGVRFHLTALCTPWLAGWAALGWAHWRGLVRSAVAVPVPPTDRRPCLVCAVVLALLAALIGFLLYRSTFYPVFLWDSIAYWDLKARAFFVDRGILPLVTDPYYDWAHLDYPQLVPLSGALVYLSAGGPHEIVQAVPVAFFATLLVLFFGAMRREGASRRLALALTAALALMPNLLFWGHNFQGESALACYAFGTAAFFCQYLRDRSFHSLLLSALLAAFLTQTKIEGPFFAVPALLLLAARALRRRQGAGRDLLTYLGVLGAAALPWQLFQYLSGPRHTGFLSASMVAAVREHAAAVPGIARAISGWISTPALGAMGLVFLLLAACLAMRGPRLWRSPCDQYLLGFLAASLAPYALLWMALPRYLEPLALDRFLLVFTVTAHFSVALQVARCLDEARWSGGLLLAAAGGVLVGVVAPQTTWMGGLPAGGGITWTPAAAAARWRVARNSCELARSGEDLLVRRARGMTCVIDLGETALDPGANAAWTLLARGEAGSRTAIELRWRTKREAAFPRDKRFSASVQWTGNLQRVELQPEWKDVPELLRVALGNAETPAGPLWIRRVEIRPRAGDRTRSALENVGRRAGPAFALAGIAVALALRLRPAHTVSSLALVWGGLIVLAWLVPDTWLGTPRRQLSRPLSLAREVLDEAPMYETATGPDRVALIEAQLGKADLGKSLVAMDSACPGGNVALFVRPWNEEETDPGRLGLGVEQLYTVIRLNQRLYPRKTVVVTQRSELLRLLRIGAVRQAVGFETGMPEGLPLAKVHHGLWWAACSLSAAEGRALPAFPPAANRPPARTRVGVFDPAEGRWQLAASRPAGAPPMALEFGRRGDLPLAGDWDGDSVESAGVFRPSERVFLLRESNRPGAGTLTIRFGREGDLPIAGDWDGDRVDEIGVYRPSEAAFVLGEAPTRPWAATRRIPFGAPGDLPVVGDWNGDGIDDLGVYRPSEAAFFLSGDDGVAGAGPRARLLGAPGDLPLAGDWDGDGVDTLGVYRPGSGTWLLADSNEAPSESAATVRFGRPGLVPVCGSWQGSPWWAME